MEESIDTLPYYDLLKKLSGCDSIKIVDVAANADETIPEDIEKMLGKRKVTENAEPTEENDVVECVDFIPTTTITTTNVVIDKSENKKQKKSHSGELPQSIKERYGMIKQHKQKAESIVEETKRTAEVHETEMKKPKVAKDWSAVYGEASKHIGKLIEKQSQMLQEREKAEEANQNKGNDKNQKKGGPKGKNDKGKPQQQHGGAGKQEKKPKYYLGSSIAGDRKFNAF